MVRIQGNKLIIEIDCKSNNPLEILANYQEGLLNMFRIADTSGGKNNPETVDFGMKMTADLMKQLLISTDQQAIIKDALSKDQLAEFNRA